MNKTNPEIEEQLDKLADICCELLGGEQTASIDETDALLKSLLMSGFARSGGAPLQVEIESRVKSKCREPAMHRGGELSSITGQLQKKFNDLVRWESRQPDDRTEPKTANISSATDA